MRKANRDQPGPYTMHGDKIEGYEVVPTNIAFTAAGLGLSHDEFDYNQTAPQADAFKAFMKSHLVQGHPIVWLPLCKGDPHIGRERRAGLSTGPLTFVAPEPRRSRVSPQRVRGVAATRSQCRCDASAASPRPRPLAATRPQRRRAPSAEALRRRCDPVAPPAGYPGTSPGPDGGGGYDHVEPIYGIYSKHSLDDATVYDDDIIVHQSDQDDLPYYRRMDTLEDTRKMDGNCASAQAGFGKNEMYPCFYESVTYRRPSGIYTWIFGGDESRRRRDRDVDIPWGHIAAAPRRGYTVGTSRGGAATATWIFRGDE